MFKLNQLEGEITDSPNEFASQPAYYAIRRDGEFVDLRFQSLYDFRSCVHGSTGGRDCLDVETVVTTNIVTLRRLKRLIDATLEAFDA